MKNYALKKKVIDFLKNHQACREELCKAMNIQRNALDYHISNNVPNGSLTKFQALEIISKYYNEDISNLVELVKFVKEVA